ncbi:hypothetical protein COD14_25425 [Bacillus cereus]|nr:hypothetical protein COD14_25425 [Bacillus cereus]
MVNFLEKLKIEGNNYRHLLTDLTQTVSVASSQVTQGATGTTGSFRLTDHVLVYRIHSLNISGGQAIAFP